jgi:hypothetical protein
LAGLWKQSFGNGMWNVFTLTLNRKALSVRHFVPVAFVATLLSCLFLGILWPGFHFLLAGVVAFYLGAGVAASLVCCRRTARKTWRGKVGLCLVLPLVFATLHIGYGVGYIWGFAGLNRFRKQRALRQR